MKIFFGKNVIPIESYGEMIYDTSTNTWDNINICFENAQDATCLKYIESFYIYDTGSVINVRIRVINSIVDSIVNIKPVSCSFLISGENKK